MFLNDADRLTFIKGLGGQLVRAPGGDFWAVFDNEAIDVLGDSIVRTYQPALSSCLTSDIQRVKLVKDDQIEVGSETYRVKDIQPDQASGMTIVPLKR